MSKAVTVGDNGTDHDGFPPTPVTAGSPTVNFDGKPAARVGDPLAPHAKPHHPPHARKISSGSSTVFIDGKPAAITGGAISCGGVTIGGGTVNIGDRCPSGASSSSRAASSASSQTQAAEASATDSQAQSTPPGQAQAKPTQAAGPTAQAGSVASASESAASDAPYVPPESGYWPPYDFTKDKPLDVEYTQKPVDLAVMSLEEAEEFANNLWADYCGKDTLSNTKKIWDGADNANKAYQLAKGLGGMGVTVYVKQANGKDYVIIKGYKKHLKTLVKGNRWRANHPQVVQLGLGSKNMARNMLRMGLVVDITFSVAINAVDVFVHDEKTMEDFVGRSGVDIAKGMLATGVGTVSAIGVSVAGLPIIAVGLTFAGISVGAAVLFDAIDNHYGISDNLVNAIKEYNQ